MKVTCTRFGLVLGAGFAALLYAAVPVLAATAPDLGQAQSFGVLAGSTATNTGLRGSYVNTLVAGALVTGNGNNAAPAVATLTVVSLVLPPTLGKAFSPATIDAGSVSTLTLTVSNPDATVATLTDPLIDTLPSGVVIAATPDVGTTCGGRRWRWRGARR